MTVKASSEKLSPLVTKVQDAFIEFKKDPTTKYTLFDSFLRLPKDSQEYTDLLPFIDQAELRTYEKLRREINQTIEDAGLLFDTLYGGNIELFGRQESNVYSSMDREWLPVFPHRLQQELSTEQAIQGEEELIQKYLSLYQLLADLHKMNPSIHEKYLKKIKKQPFFKKEGDSDWPQYFKFDSTEYTPKEQIPLHPPPPPRRWFFSRSARVAPGPGGKRKKTKKKKKTRRHKKVL